MARRAALLVVSLALVAAPVAASAEAVRGSDSSPGARAALTTDPGSEVATRLYDLGDVAFTDPRSGTVSEVRGVVHAPVQLDGALPVVVMVHGSWWACTKARASLWPCDKGAPFPSYRGYDYLGDHLAARGFVVVSLSMDAINLTSFDYGDRARLLNQHLELLEELSRGTGPLAAQLPDLVGHLDMTRVGTMGHSRGGKAVMWQASDRHRSAWPDGVRIRAVLGVAPVKFDEPGRGASDSLNTRVAVGVVTSGCDTAVHEAGQEYLDDVVGLTRKPAYSISLTDGNHNFFNTAWTPPGRLTDDDSSCRSRELEPAEQQLALARYADAFYARFLQGDRSATALLRGDKRLRGVRSEVRHVRPVD